MAKQVRAFNLDEELVKEINLEAALIGPSKASALVNELLREALERRRNIRVMGVAVGVGQSVATLFIAATLLFAFSVLS